MTPNGIDQASAPAALVRAAQETWDRAIELGEAHGFRNAQATVIAPRAPSVGHGL